MSLGTFVESASRQLPPSFARTVRMSVQPLSEHILHDCETFSLHGWTLNINSVGGAATAIQVSGNGINVAFDMVRTVIKFSVSALIWTPGYLLSKSCAC